MEGDTLLRDASARWVRQGVEQSLRNLGNDYIGLYQVHWLDPHTPFAETASILNQLVQEGKIRYVGVSNYSMELVCLYMGLSLMGLLAGRFTPQMHFHADDWRSKSPVFHGELFQKNLAIVEQLKIVAEWERITVAQLALAWVLANPAVNVATVGARYPQHIEQSVHAADVQLSQQALQNIAHIMQGAIPIGGPMPEGV